MKKLKFVCLSLMMMIILGLSLLFVRVPVRASVGLGYIEEEGFNTYRYQTMEVDGPIIVDLTYPNVIVEGYEIPIEISLVDFPSEVGPVVINRVRFHEQQFDVYVTEYQSDVVDFYVDPSYYKDKIMFTYLRYTYMGSNKFKTITTELPVTVISQIEYYEYLIGSLEEENSSLREAVESEYGRGYDEGYDVGHNDGYNAGYYAGYGEGYGEAGEEINALGEVVPSALGGIWLVVRDFLSIEIFGIAIWEVVGAFVAIGIAIIIVRMFL